MTEQEYFNRVETARRHISGGQLETAGRLLTEMYAYKPTRLLWFVAKAEYILRKDRNPEAALKLLDGKYFLGDDYPGLKECMKLRSKAYRQMGRKDDSIREDYLYQKVCGRSCARLEGEVAEALEAVASDAEDEEALRALAGALYHTSDPAAYFIVYMELIRRGCMRRTDHWVHQLRNFGYLEEKIAAEEPGAFILVMDEYLDRSLEILGHLLSCFGHRVYLLTPPLTFETEGRVDLRETVSISMGQAERYPDMCVIPPVALTEGGAAYGDNRDYIIDHICREESPRDHAVVLCSGFLLEDLYTRAGLRGRMGRLSLYESDICEEKVQFGWAGSYLSYISDIYGYDVRQDLEREPEVDFSIVIPARNSSATLRYTLQTCLRQRYQGSYEIVISDNSVDGSTEVYELCRELNSPKIRYVKTPRSLTLPKSFEFGYLQTRGAFVLSIGSDDGLLPWGLEVIKAVLDQYPEEEILLWERGFYAWPGFNGGQENMFVIPRQYAKEQVGAQYLPTEYLLDLLAKDQQMMYALPMLYINSGFQRRYLKTLLQKTGKLLDGVSQDIPMAIINCCIHERVLSMIYPITIAGMSSASIGYLNNRPDGEKETKQGQIGKTMFQQENLGIYVFGERERRLLPVGADTCDLYIALSRAVEEGLLAEEDADRVLNWETAVTRIVETFSIENEIYDLMIHRNLLTARTLCAEHYGRFRAVCEQALTPRYISADAVKRQRAVKTYVEEPNAQGGETLDASSYNVHNVRQAVELFSTRTGL